jgi:O-methyltransferase domain/Dimerisation domain
LKPAVDAATLPLPAGVAQMPDIAQMWSMITGYWVSQVVRATARLSLADHLARGPASAAEIAALESTDPDATARLLRACASIGLVTYDAARQRFASTSLLATLCRDVPGSQYGMAMGLTGPAQYWSWTSLSESVRTGRRATPNVLGMELWEYYKHHPDEGADFTLAMSALTDLSVQAVAPLIETDSVAVAVDVGGAAGALLLTLMARDPRLNGIVLDRPHVIHQTKLLARQHGLDHRLTAVAGDFFDSVPTGDLYLLKHVLHDWDDESCVTILGNCRRAMRRGGRIAVIELVLGEIGQEPSHAPLMDLAMLVHVPGRERSAPEYESLLRRADMSVRRIAPTPSPYMVIEAVVA